MLEGQRAISEKGEWTPSSYADLYQTGAVRVDHQSYLSIGTGGMQAFLVKGQDPGRIVVPGIANATVQVALRGIGPAEFDLGSGRFRGHAHPGTWLVTPPNQGCVFEPQSSLDLLVLELSPILTDAWGGHYRHLHQGLSDHPSIAELAKAVWSESENPTGLGHLWTDSALLVLHGLLGRLAGSGPAQIPKGGLAAWQQRRCLDYLHDNIATEVRLDAISSLVGLSTFHFCRAFKQSIGVPPHRYHMSLRIAHSKRLLEDRRYSITDIAMEVGYESSQGFARAFRKEAGLSPTDYRRSVVTS